MADDGNGRAGTDDGAPEDPDAAGMVDGEPPAAVGTDDGPAPAQKSGTFLVTTADPGSAELSDVADGQVLPLGSNPGLEAGEVVRATLEPEGPLGVTWRLAGVGERWTPAIEALDELPGERARELAPGEGTGRLARVRIDGGELHVLRVDDERTDGAVADVVADEATRRIAARLGARRVEVRGGAGVVAMRYLRSE